VRKRGLECLGLLALGLWSSGQAAADEISIAVATNFAAAMNDIVEPFERQTGHTVLVSSGSTGNHYAQIKNGAPFEAFFSADTARPRLLEQGSCLSGQAKSGGSPPGADQSPPIHA